MQTIQHELTIHAPVSLVYESIATAEGISAWWDPQTPVQTEQGLVLEHNPGPAHGIVRLMVVALVPNRRVEWECISHHPASSPASAWTGTRFIFELTARGAATTSLEFRQTGYDEHSSFFDSNRQAWWHVLQNLKRVVEERTTSAP